ncbi:DUF6522 family protein [Maliponia aquimaris]|uniref:Uncharacterized protein n=1 Tax=Maliponia aquimaris TaxID=1673631 RepID=A0A238L1E8_9RHOB|nr:DUF6522 family protein [Maliponia aquimaris]SMX48914.1 hypothetical protein MAA8898_04169 [Maliponia aquimaris]
MSEVEHDGEQFIVDAQVLSRAFNLPPEDIRARMQAGQITSVCETGEGEDAGRWRLTFRHQGRALRLIVDANAQILSRATFPVSQPPAEGRAGSDPANGPTTPGKG